MQALIVDDSRVTRLILGHVLKQVGFEVVEAGNGNEGLAQLEQLKRRGLPEVVLVDWNMPEMDGGSFLRAVRADPVTRDLRIIVVSGEDSAAQETIARDAGADASIKKPFTRETIVAKLAKLGIELS